jgi:hypothetical protein
MLICTYFTYGGLHILTLVFIFCFTTDDGQSSSWIIYVGGSIGLSIHAIITLGDAADTAEFPAPILSLATACMR